jgi:hypothetical protein
VRAAWAGAFFWAFFCESITARSDGWVGVEDHENVDALLATPAATRAADADAHWLVPARRRARAAHGGVTRAAAPRAVHSAASAAAALSAGDGEGVHSAHAVAAAAAAAGGAGAPALALAARADARRQRDASGVPTSAISTRSAGGAAAPTAGATAGVSSRREEAAGCRTRWSRRPPPRPLPSPRPPSPPPPPCSPAAQARGSAARRPAWRRGTWTSR